MFKLQRTLVHGVVMLVLLCSSIHLIKAQTPKSVEKAVELLNEFNSRFPMEKVYIHTDRKHYAAGEPVWFQVYVVAGYFHEPSPLSNNVYVALYNEDREVQDEQLVRANLGAGHGVIDLPDSLPAGNYVLRAYTNWMKNFDEQFFFEKELVVLGDGLNTDARPSSDIDLQFFPEGGQLVDKVATRVAFKAVGKDGLAREVKGLIYDDANNEITSFETSHDGMGLVVFSPEVGKSYHAKISGSGSSYPLPLVQQEGYGLSVNNNLKDVLRLTVRSNESTKKKGPLGVVVHARGAISYTFEVDVSKNIALANLPKADMPAGINHITLFDQTGRALVERLVFIDHNQGELVLNLDHDQYTPRQKVTANIEIKDQNGNPVSGVFSMAAIDLSQSIDQKPQETIISNLLLSSDLRGHIDNPMYYFDPANADSKKYLDLVMMTNGWTRFTWDDLPEKTQGVPTYSVEQGLNITGTLLRAASTKAADGGQVTLVNQESLSPMILQAQADENGRFTFENVILFDNEEVVFQGVNKRDNPSVEFALDTLLELSHPNQFHTPLSLDKSIGTRLADFQEKKDYRDRIEEAYNFDTTATILETVVVEGSRVKTKEEDEARRSPYGKGETTLRFDDSDITASRNALEMIQGKIAGVTVSGSGTQATVQIRSAVGGGLNALSPLILLDDVRTDLSNIIALPASLVERVEVFKGPSTAIFGVNGAGGVLAFYTKKGADLSSIIVAEGVYTTHLKNSYKQPRQFYAPRYDAKKPEHIKPDSRIVLLWQPLILIDESGKAQVEFWNSDASTEVLLDLQGITKAGVPLATTLTYHIKKK